MCSFWPGILSSLLIYLVFAAIVLFASTGSSAPPGKVHSAAASSGSKRGTATPAAAPPAQSETTPQTDPCHRGQAHRARQPYERSTTSASAALFFTDLPAHIGVSPRRHSNAAPVAGARGCRAAPLPRIPESGTPPARSRELSRRCRQRGSDGSHQPPARPARMFPPGRRLPPGPPNNGGPRYRARGRAHPESTSHRRPCNRPDECMSWGL
jgi:hypothetical protein